MLQTHSFTTLRSEPVRARCRPVLANPLNHPVKHTNVTPKNTSGFTHRPLTISTQALHNVVMFIGNEEAEDSVKLQLQPQQLLGLKAGGLHKDSIINQAYDELTMAPVEPGYSQETLSCRAELLDIVRRDIITSKGRDYDMREVNIPNDLLPGALALMAEVGQDEIVMQLGTTLLESGQLKGEPTITNDVLLSMALSKCNMAHDVFTSENQIATGCRHLEEALQLLQPKGSTSSPIAPDLVTEINRSLRELRAQCALEQVSLPLTKDQVDTRKRAVRTIRDLLKQADKEVPARGSRPGARASGADGGVSKDLVRKVVQQLTSEEVVNLVDWEGAARNPAAHSWVYPGLLERVAVGHILAGFSQCQPAYIKTAWVILKHTTVTPETLVMQAVCQVLMGAVQPPVDLLKQAQDMSSRSRGSEMRETSLMSATWTTAPHSFLIDHTPQGDDSLLPGLCLFTEEWLAQAAMPLFRDTADAGHKQTLISYFDDARVEAQIAALDDKKDAGLTTSLTSALSKLKSAVGVEGSTHLPVKSTPNRALMAGAAAVAAVGLAALVTVFKRPTNSLTATSQEATAAIAPTVKSTVIKPIKSAHMDKSTADRLVRAWQEAKQQALGPGYDTSALPVLLDDPLLSEMRDKVSQFQQDGWHTQYKLRHIKVVGVEKEGDGTVKILATLDESASVVGADRQAGDAFQSSYDAKYKVKQGKDRSWKLLDIVVQSTHQKN